MSEPLIKLAEKTFPSPYGEVGFDPVDNPKNFKVLLPASFRPLTGKLVLI